jgi:hypothetical protein
LNFQKHFVARYAERKGYTAIIDKETGNFIFENKTIKGINSIETIDMLKNLKIEQGDYNESFGVFRLYSYGVVALSIKHNKDRLLSTKHHDSVIKSNGTVLRRDFCTKRNKNIIKYSINGKRRRAKQYTKALEKKGL